MNPKAISPSLGLVAWLFLAGAALAQSPAVPTTAMRGTLTLSGCSVPAVQIELVADLVEDASLVTRRGGADGRPGTPLIVGRRPAAEATALARLRSRRAALTALPDGHSYTVDFTQLAAGRLYRLSIRLSTDAPPNPCGRVFWRGPDIGLVVAGGTTLRLEGFAARTQLEILSLAERSGEIARNPAWLGMDDLQFADAARATRSLRWRTDLPNVVAGELQISTAPFPTPGAGDSCAVPSPGVIFRQRVAVNGREWARLAPIDFSRVLAVQRSGQLTARMQKRLLMGAPLYMRVIPQAASGPLCATQENGVHGQVVVAKLPSGAVPSGPIPPTPILTAGSNQVYKPAYFPPPELVGHPNYFEVAYVATADHKVPPINCYTTQGDLAKVYQALDPMGCILVHTGILPPGGTLFKGQWFFFKPNGSSSSGWFETFVNSFGSIVTGTFDAASVGVDFVSKGFEQIKKYAANVVVDVIEGAGLGPVCDGIANSGLTSCEEIVETGIEYGLASMGVPPSIPSWEQVKQEGVDYLAAQLAAEIAGSDALAQVATEEVIKQMAQHAIDQITADRNAALGPGYDYLLPYFGFDPASWTMSVRWTGSAPLPQEKLFVERLPTALHEGGMAALPVISLVDGSDLRIPIVLPPSYKGIFNPECIYGGGLTTCTPNSWLAEPRCYNQIHLPSGTILQPMPCPLNALTIYFRDAWYFRQAITQCVSMFAMSKFWMTQAGQGGNLQISQPAPDPPFINFARVGVRDFAVWNGPGYVAPQCAL